MVEIILRVLAGAEAGRGNEVCRAASKKDEACPGNAIDTMTSSRGPRPRRPRAGSKPDRLLAVFMSLTRVTAYGLDVDERVAFVAMDDDDPFLK